MVKHIHVSARHSIIGGSIPGPGMLYFTCKILKTWLSTLGLLNIRDCVSLVGHGSSVVGAPLRNLGKFVYPTLPVSFG